MSSGYGLKKDESYYQNIMLFYNQFGYGISDYFSFSGGVSPMLTPLWITPKFSIPLIENKLNLGLGVVVSYVFNSFIGNDVLLAPYGVVTFGSRNNNVSLGFGRVIFGEDFTNSLNVHGRVKISERLSLMSENYIMPSEDSNNIVSFGGRYFFNKFSIDLLAYYFLGMDLDEDGLFLFPLLGFTIPFGK